jgi:hypothetical protein
MSKLMLVFVFCASAAICDPPRVLDNFGPQARQLGWQIKSTFAVDRYFASMRIGRG